MAERKPPPSSASTPAAGLSKKEDLKRKLRSGADADADADQAKRKPKPTAPRGLAMIDDDPVWHKPVKEYEEPASSGPKPAAWRRGFAVIDDDPVWHRPVKVDEDPAWSGDQRPLGVHYGSGRVMAASPEEQGGGSTLHQWGGARRAQGDAAGRGFSPLRQRQRRQDIPSRGSEAEEDCWPPRKGARHFSGEPQGILSPRRPVRHDSQGDIVTFAPQDTSLVVKGAKAVFRDKADAYLKFVFGSRSKREGKAWHCICKATNSPKRKLVFGLPKFHCGCGRKFLQDNDLDFCLADVRVNFELVVSKIFEQKGPHCIANSCCQAMLIMHTMDCITKGMDVKEAMACIDPTGLIEAYSTQYPLMDLGPQSPIPPSSVHKFIKMALMLKNRGIKLEDGTFWRIGDISFIAKDNYEAICEELANGVPLLAIITPGINFQYLKYCEVYRPPLLQDFHECNNYHTQHKHRVHEAHMVVLVGPAFKAKGKNAGRAYYFVNSHEQWCPRKVIDDTHELGAGIEKPVDYGIGKIEEKGLVYSVIKLWKFGETAGPDSIKLEDEDEDEANIYQNKISNRQKFTGASL